MYSWVDGDAVGDEVLQSNIALAAVLGSILGADAPSLRRLSVSSCGLDETAFTFLLDGLARNTHLEELYLNDDFNFEDSNPFVTNRLLPAVQRCPSLRRLFCSGRRENMAERFVAARAAGAQ